MRSRAFICLLLSCMIILPGSAFADITGTQKIRDNVDKKLKDLDISSMSNEEKEKLLASPVRLNINMIVPIYGSYILDNTLYGSIRPPAYIFDWTLGGIVPLGLLGVSILGRNRYSGRKIKIMRITALSLYLVTRIGVFVTINEHIYQYNKYMKQRLNIESAGEGANINIGYRKLF